MPFNAAADDSSNTGGGLAMRGDPTCNPNHGGPHTNAEYFNTACFPYPKVRGNGTDISEPPPNTFGTEHRNDIFGPRNTNVDLSAFKEFAIYDRLKFQFRTDAFSALNHPLPQQPQITISAANFGQITGWGGTRML